MGIGGSAPPTVPDFTVTGFDVTDVPDEGTVVTASASVANLYPVIMDIPSLTLSLIIPGCTPSDRIRVTDAIIAPLSIRPDKDIVINLRSVVSSLPAELSTPCADDGLSPLEALMQTLLDPDQNATVFITASREKETLPEWLTRILSSITIPIPIPRIQSNTSDLISSIHCTEMKVSFPSPWAPPDVPAGKPRISGLIEAVILPPKQIDKVSVNVTALRTDVYLSDEGDKFGRIVVPVWNPAVTERRKKLHVKTRVAEVPIEVLDPIVFQRVMAKVFRGEGSVTIGVDGTVDAKATVLIGDFTLRGIPVHGDVDVEGISPFGDLNMSLIGGINVASTTKNSITLTSTVEVKNPTEYEAVVPYLNLHLLYDGSGLLSKSKLTSQTFDRKCNCSQCNHLKRSQPNIRDCYIRSRHDREYTIRRKIPW